MTRVQVDKLAYKEQEVPLLVKLGRLEEGAELYKALLAMNPDNYRFFFNLFFHVESKHSSIGVVWYLIKVSFFVKDIHIGMVNTALIILKRLSLSLCCTCTSSFVQILMLYLCLLSEEESDIIFFSSVQIL